VTFSYKYTTKGFLQYVKDGAGTFNIYEALGTTKYNAPVQYKLGNGKTSNITYNEAGLATEYKTLHSGSTYIQNLAMSINLSNGNITQREDKTKTAGMAIDVFDYNYPKDQLKTITTNGSTANMVTIAYDDTKNSNIQSRTGLGTYTYDGTKKHAVTKVETTCSENVTLATGSQQVAYTPFNKAAKITNITGVNTYDVLYTYGPDEERTMSVLKLNGTVQKTRYYFGSYEKEVTGANTKHIYYINGGNGLCAIATKDNAGSLIYHYVYTDHLGSIVKMTDNVGTTEVEQSFDAWGRQRNPNDWSDYLTVGASPPSGAFSWLTRGYTGHEHVPQVGLINMNGRMYDPVIGRMLSADKYVADPSNSQDYNRYAYVRNNPIKYTDPSGWRLHQAPAEPLEPSEADNSRLFGGGGAYVGRGSSGGISYNYMGSYSTFLNDPTHYANIYGTQTGIQNASARIYYDFALGVYKRNDKVISYNEAISTYEQRGDVVHLSKVYGSYIQNGVETQKQYLYSSIILNGNEVRYNESDAGGNDFSMNNFVDGVGQLTNATGVMWGSAELAVQYLRQTHIFAQGQGKYFGIGTQQAAKRISNFTGVLGKAGKVVGVAGYGLSALTLTYKVVNGQNISTAEKVGFGMSTALIGAAYFAVGTAAAPFVAGFAVAYGVGELGSYLFTGKTLEDHIFKP